MSVEEYIKNVLFRRMDENKLTALLRSHYERQGKLGEWGDIRDAYTCLLYTSPSPRDPL